MWPPEGRTQAAGQGRFAVAKNFAAVASKSQLKVNFGLSRFFCN
jgi:hypothetical protein